MFISQESTPPPVTQGQMQIGKFNSKAGTKDNIETNNNKYVSQTLMPGVNKKDTASSYSATQNGEKENNKSQTGAINDDPITRYTFWLVIFTGLLVACNVALGFFTMKSANAAKKAADALPTIERAYVFVNMNGYVDYIEKELKYHFLCQ